MVGCAIKTNNKGKTGNSDTNNSNQPWVRCRSHDPGGALDNSQVMCHGQGGLNERPFDGTS